MSKWCEKCPRTKRLDCGDCLVCGKQLEDITKLFIEQSNLLNYLRLTNKTEYERIRRECDWEA